MALYPSSADSELPHIETAWDAKRMREIFERVLQPSGAPPVEIRSCRISRFRYRENVRCIAHYELDIAEPGADETSPNQRLWVTGLMYSKNRDAQVGRDLRRSLGKAEPSIGDLRLEPIAFIPELGMHVQVFPVDRYLPILPSCLTALPQDFLEPVLAEFGPGVWQPTNIRIDTVRYRPLQGATLRYTVSAHEPTTKQKSTRAFYLKLSRRAAAGDSHATLRMLEAASDAGTFPLKLAPIVAYSEKRGALLLGAASGTSLEESIATGSDAVAKVTATAAALADFHTGNTPTSRIWAHKDFSADAHRAATLIRWADPLSGPVLERIVDALEGDPNSSLFQPVHLDLKTEHVFLDGERVTVIDFDNLAAGDPLIDAAMMTVRIGETTGAEADVGALAEQFKSEYLARVPAAWERRFAPNHAYALLQIALFRVRHQDPGWQNTVRGLLTRAANAISRHRGH